MLAIPRHRYNTESNVLKLFVFFSNSELFNCKVTQIVTLL